VKNSRLVWAALAVAAAGSWSVYATACDKNKSSASAANASYSAKTAGASSCASKTASSSGCSAHTMDATAASHEGCGGSASTVSAVTASTAGAKSMKVAGAEGCCSAKSAKNTSAAAAGGAACGSAMAGVSSAACTGQALTMAMCKDSHAGCDACEDMGAFDAELTTFGAAVQVVPIKNGAMFVYTAAAPGKVNALQSAVTRRSEQLQKIVAAGDKAHLCDGCKAMRGAMASGKVTREVVSIEGGSLALVTSNDPAMVRQIRAMVDAGKTAVRVKS
jgi:hypothetical protein